jgi:hypothetical protein
MRNLFHQRGSARRCRSCAERQRLRNRRLSLSEMLDFGDVSGGVGELEAHTFAKPAGQKAAALDHRHLVRHVGVGWIVGDSVDADCGTISPGLYSCATVVLRLKLIDDPCNGI